MGMEQDLSRLTKSMYDKEPEECENQELYYVLLTLAKEEIGKREAISGKKKLYYISAEFLIGRLLANNLINLGLYEEVEKVLQSYGKSLPAIEEVEPEPSLGNGGLGRLAACFLDSIATLGLCGDGVGLNYHFGLFKQVFTELRQGTEPNEWIENQSWLKKTDTTFDITLGRHQVKSRMYDIDVVGFQNGYNKLHLFDIESVRESIVHDGIQFNKKKIDENLTLFLYPDDSDEAGNLLRIYQQYFMVSNAAKLIIKERKDRGENLHKLNEYAVIQINDTHPTMIIPELIRILTSEEGFSMDEAIEVVSKTCAYTNHTILSEALEKWPLAYLKRAVPALVPIIKELAKRVAKKYPDKEVQIIDQDKRVHMAHIDIHYGFSVNGVAAIHTQILKDTELHAFYELYPEKFNNKTNGITFRRWLLSCNKALTKTITNKIGTGYQKNAEELKKLLLFENDKKFLDELEGIKNEKKLELTDYIYEKEGIRLNPDSIFDIQIKRMHEYKRQQMNALYIIHKYLEIKSGKKPVRPITFIFGAKAAPAYIIAQDIIHLILVMQQIIAKDKKVSPYMQVIMVENYNVSYAEKLIPACDISEQISLASKEASGTGNMKLMLNGAVTLGTADGANVEIRELVGSDNIYQFGKNADEVIAHYQNHDYISKDYYRKSPVKKKAVNFIVSKKALAVGHQENLERLYKELLNKDWFMTLLDLEEYIEVKDKMLDDYEDREKWKRMMLHNIAMSGFFSSDRTIEEYNRDIWHLK